MANDAAKTLVGPVVGAKQVAVHQQGRGPIEVDAGRIGEQVAAGVRKETPADEEVAVAGQDGAAGTAGGQVSQGGADGGVGGFVIVVANPRIEEVAQDVEGLGLPGLPTQEIEEEGHCRRPFRRQVEVGDEEA